MSPPYMTGWYKLYFSGGICAEFTPNVDQYISTALLFPHFCYIVFRERCNKPSLKEWSLIMGRGGGYKTDAKGGGVKFYPYNKKGAENVLVMLKEGGRGHTKF